MTYGIFTAPRPSKKKKLTIHDVNRMTTVQGNIKPNETLRTFTQAEDARIKAEQAAKEAADQRRADEAARPAREAANERVRRYWKNTSLEDIRINGLSMTPDDPAGDYELGPRDNRKEVETYKTFRSNLESHGCTMTQDAATLLGSYMTSLSFHRGVSLTSVENWAAALFRLQELGVFPSGGVTGYHQPTSPTPRKESTQANPLDELEELTLETREGSRRGREIVNGLVGDEERAVWFQFIKELEAKHELTHAEGMAIFNLMKHRGLDFRNKKHLRMAVVALCNSGELPATFLSEQDKLNTFIEQADLSDFSTRQKVNAWQRRIDEANETKNLGY